MITVASVYPMCIPVIRMCSAYLRLLRELTAEILAQSLRLVV